MTQIDIHKTIRAIVPHITFTVLKVGKKVRKDVGNFQLDNR